MQIDWSKVKVGDRFLSLRSSLGALGYAKVKQIDSGRITFELTQLDDTPAMDLTVSFTCNGDPSCNGENCQSCALCLRQLHLVAISNPE